MINLLILFRWLLEQLKAYLVGNSIYHLYLQHLFCLCFFHDQFIGDAPEKLLGANISIKASHVDSQITDVDVDNVKAEEKVTTSGSYTWRMRDKTRRYELDPGVYGIIPHTFSPGVELDFLLRIATEKPAETG